jgi:hypothetical protein
MKEKGCLNLGVSSNQDSSAPPQLPCPLDRTDLP